jgi:Xaa-Pro dipeptidase
LGTVDPRKLARNSRGAALTDTEPQADMVRLRAYRLGRVQEQLRQRDYSAILLYDPLNIRYATGSRNMTVWKMHSTGRYAFVPAEGRSVIFDAPNSLHLSKGLETVAEARPTTAWSFLYAGHAIEANARKWAAEIAELQAQWSGRNRRIACDNLNPIGARMLSDHGIEIFDGTEVMELARVIKSPDEIELMKTSVAVCETGMARMRQALEPGITENELWSILHQTNIAKGGEWIETRCLSSGGRTNPWLQEASDRIIRAGELVSFDTDLVGPFGYMADVSRTFYCGFNRPNDEQRRLYSISYEQLQHDIALVRAGMTFREFAEAAWSVPPEFLANRYGCVAHGVGMCDEYPIIGYSAGPQLSRVDGVLEENMTICVESYVGAEGGTEGVKLEEQVLVTAQGAQLLSTFPFEERLLG